MRYIITKEAAQLLRTALKATFPGTTFSVRCDRGSASAWIRVSWTDGPLETAVTPVGYPFQGAQFNPMTDSYDELPTQLLCTAPGELPEEVHYVVDGILYSRTLSTAAHDLVVDRIEKALHITVPRTDSAGIAWNTARTQPVHNAHVDGKVYCTDGDHYDLADLIHQVAAATDMAPVTGSRKS
jgi:hypothetical protein